MPGSAFHEWLSQLEADGFVRPWSGLGVLGEGGAFMPAPEGGAPRYIGVGGMGTIAEQLAGGLVRGRRRTVAGGGETATAS